MQPMAPVGEVNPTSSASVSSSASVVATVFGARLAVAPAVVGPFGAVARDIEDGDDVAVADFSSPQPTRTDPATASITAAHRSVMRVTLPAEFSTGRRTV